MAAQELRGGVEHDVGAVGERGLPKRPQECVVDHHDGLALAGVDFPDECGDAGDVDERVGGIRGRLDQHAADVRVGELCAQARRDLLDGHASGEADGADAELRQHGAQHVVGAAVEGLAVHDDVAGAAVGEQAGCDGGHAAHEHAGGFGVVPEC